ncbi:hypothetical protein M758_2G022800 [Ceratodon purpureus]|nr:hypothetical protein M758_2G022800 [Ceratodon purpureus]
MAENVPAARTQAREGRLQWKILQGESAPCPWYGSKPDVNTDEQTMEMGQAAIALALGLQREQVPVLDPALELEQALALELGQELERALVPGLELEQALALGLEFERALVLRLELELELGLEPELELGWEH